MSEDIKLKKYQVTRRLVRTGVYEVQCENEDEARGEIEMPWTNPRSLDLDLESVEIVEVLS